jgi:hypothetical protein
LCDGGVAGAGAGMVVLGIGEGVYNRDQEEVAVSGGWGSRQRVAPLKRYTIDCREVASFEDFVAAVNTGFIRHVGGMWNGNLDAFNDTYSGMMPSNLSCSWRRDALRILGTKLRLDGCERILRRAIP